MPLSVRVDPEGRVAGVEAVEDLAAKVRPRPRGEPRDRSHP